MNVFHELTETMQCFLIVQEICWTWGRNVGVIYSVLRYIQQN